MKLHIDQMVRNRNLRVWNDVVERGSVTKSQKGNKAYVEREVGECFQWKAHRQCSKGGPCSFSHDGPLASGNEGKGQRRKGRSSSPASHPKAKRTDCKKDDKEENSDKRNQILCDLKIVIFRRVIFGIFPCVKITSLKKVVFLAINAIFDMLRRRRSPARSRRKVVQKDQLLC